MTNKVVHLVPSFGCGGLEKVIVNLINNSSHLNLEHVIISLTDELTMKDQLTLPIEIISLNKKPGNDISTHFKLFSLLRKMKPIALQSYNFATLEYHFIAKLAGVKKLIHSDHGRGGDHPEGKNKLHNFLRYLVGRVVNHYVVVSHDLKKWVIESILIPEKKVSLVFNGVKINKNISASVKNPINFISVGRLDPVKNQTLMIESFVEAINEGLIDSNSVLRVVGDGPSRKVLENIIEQLNASNYVVLLGYQADVESFLLKSDAFLLSSVYEAMPMTILEAMANKIPVLCTDVGGISQFISDESAWISPSKDKQAYKNYLSDLQKNEVERLDKINTAYDLVCEKYSIETMVDRYCGFYQ